MHILHNRDVNLDSNIHVVTELRYGRGCKCSDNDIITTLIRVHLCTFSFKAVFSTVSFFASSSCGTKISQEETVKREVVTLKDTNREAGWGWERRVYSRKALLAGWREER